MGTGAIEKRDFATFATSSIAPEDVLPNAPKLSKTLPKASKLSLFLQTLKNSRKRT